MGFAAEWGECGCDHGEDFEWEGFGDCESCPFLTFYFSVEICKNHESFICKMADF